MTQFHEGQDVEVLRYVEPMPERDSIMHGWWRQAKIVQEVKPSMPSNKPARWVVRFTDETHAVLYVDHIRPVSP